MKRYVKNMRDIALTIDVEPDVPPILNTWRGVEEGLPILLELLEKHGVRATFFVTAQTSEIFPKLVNRISRENHEVGCHGYEHERYDRLNPKEQSKKVELATKAITKIMGRRPMGFRAPNFRPTLHVFAAIERAGYIYDASVASYKTDPGSSRFTFVEIPNTLPSSVLRLPISFSAKLLRLCIAALPPTVLDYHPWEVIEMPREVRFDCRFATGETALHRLDRLLAYLLGKRANFRLMREIAENEGSRRSGGKERSLSRISRSKGFLLNHCR